VMQVPMLDLRAQYRSIKSEVLAAMEPVLESQMMILGPEVTALEAEIASFSGAEYGVGVSSGTDALLVALMALGVGAGDEVITTPFSFFATAGVIARLGAKPVFVDVLPDTLNLDPSQVASAVTDRTRAIMPVHLYGRVADMDPLLELGRSKGIPVVEDAAQAIGAFDGQNRLAGSMGELGCFSFFPSKNLGAFGDAGMVTARDEALADRVRVLRAHGASPKYYHSLVGGNFRIDALQAAILRVKLRHLPGWTAGRRANAERYRNLFEEAGLTDRVALPPDEPGHIYNQFVIRVPRRDELRAALQAAGIGTQIYYPVPLHLQVCFEDLGYEAGDLPESEQAALDSLAIPVYPELTEEQQAYVVSTVAGFYEGGVGAGVRVGPGGVATSDQG